MGLKKSKIVVITASLGAVIAMVSMTIAQAEEPNKVKVKLPKNPEIWEIHKSLKKEDFQPNVVENNSSIEDPSLKNNPTIVRSLRGFVGPNYVTEVNGRNAVILNNSLNTSIEGNWEVKGLVRNETQSNVGIITVEAQLLSSDGTVLDTVITDSMVKNIRPGEPVPFVIKSTISASQVSEVKWITGTKNIGESKSISREANIMVNYELPFGQANYMGIPRDDAPYPYVLATSFDNLSIGIKKAQIVAAWLDETGKVVWIETVSLDPAFSNGVPQDGSAVFQNIIVKDSEIAPMLNQIPYTLWVVGK